jgi:ABC-type Zn uptake system ZnuABC Zn-binding protein ZnuA
MTQRLAITFLLLAVPALILAGCGDDDGDAGASGDKIQVITTLPLFADFVREIGGDRVEVTSLLPLGADPHTFEPSPRDVEKITEADIAFANGLDLEPSLIDVIEKNLPDKASVIYLGEVAVEAGAETLEGETHNEEGEEEPSGGTETPGTDPHMWMNPTNAIFYVYSISQLLSEIDPNGASSFEENRARYTDEIATAGDSVRGKLDGTPGLVRKLVTTHDAFGYFADAYGLEVTEFVAESPGQEPSPQDIADLRAAIEEQSVPAVFTEPQVSEESEILEQAAADAGVEVCALYSDSLDDGVSTYIEMMRFNADELARCLGAQ